VRHRPSGGCEHISSEGQAPRSKRQKPVRAIKRGAPVILDLLTWSRMSTRVRASSPCNDIAVFIPS